MAPKGQFTIFYALSLAFQLGFLIAVPILIFIFIGLWMDNNFHSTPVFILVGIFVGVGISIYEIYHCLAPLIKKNKHV